MLAYFVLVLTGYEFINCNDLYMSNLNQKLSLSLAIIEMKQFYV